MVGVHTQAEQSDAVLSVMCHAGESADAIKRHAGLQQQRLECGRQPEVSPNSAVKGVRAPVVHCKKNVNHPVFSQTAEALLESCAQGKTICSKEATTRGVSQRLTDNGTLEHLNSAPLALEQAAAVNRVVGAISEPVHGGKDLHSVRNDIQGGFWKFVLNLLFLLQIKGCHCLIITYNHISSQWRSMFKASSLQPPPKTSATALFGPSTSSDGGIRTPDSSRTH